MIAGRLQLSGDVGEDPHVERLIESFALLASRIHKRLDDDFPLLLYSCTAKVGRRELLGFIENNI